MGPDRRSISWICRASEVEPIAHATAPPLSSRPPVIGGSRSRCSTGRGSVSVSVSGMGTSGPCITVSANTVAQTIGVSLRALR
jgi:hypothetical protein